MRHIIFLIFSLLLSNLLNAQNNLETIQLKEQNMRLEVRVSLLEKHIDSLALLPDKIQHSGQIEIQNGDNKSWIEFLFPSLIALIVALFALFGTIYSGKKQRQSSENQLKIQLKEGQATLASQIKSSNKIIQKQIDSEKQVAELNFRQNVLSTNRQNWINDLRNIMSEVIPLTEFVGKRNSMSDEDSRKLSEFVLKAELMVNPQKDKDFISAVKKMDETVRNILLGEAEFSDLSDPKLEVLNLTKKTLKVEWERVKKGE